MRRSSCATLLAAALFSAGLAAQTSAPARPLQFDVVSIKRSAPDATSGGIRRLPDGTLVMTNQPIRGIIMSASPVPTREVVGAPDWVNTERYDVTAKPPAGTTREQRAEMMRNMFAERMMLLGHVEQRERNTFALVVARSDGRLGPQLKPSTLDCTAGPRTGAPPQVPLPMSEMQNVAVLR